MDNEDTLGIDQLKVNDESDTGPIPVDHSSYALVQHLASNYPKPPIRDWKTFDGHLTRSEIEPSISSALPGPSSDAGQRTTLVNNVNDASEYGDIEMTSYPPETLLYDNFRTRGRKMLSLRLRNLRGRSLSGRSYNISRRRPFLRITNSFHRRSLRGYVNEAEEHSEGENDHRWLDESFFQRSSGLLPSHKRAPSTWIRKK